MVVECYGGGGGGGGGVVPFCGVALVVVAHSLPVNKTLSIMGKKKNKPVRVSCLEALSLGFLFLLYGIWTRQYSGGCVLDGWWSKQAAVV